MKSYREELTFETKTRRAYINKGRAARKLTSFYTIVPPAAEYNPINDPFQI